MKLILWLTLGLIVHEMYGQTNNQNVFRTEAHQVTENVITMVRPDWTRNFVVGNITVILTDQGVVVYDGGNGPEVADQAIQEIKKRTRLPVKYLIISHGHIDHTGGIHQFRQEWPDMEIIGHNSLYSYLEKSDKRLERYIKTNYERWDKRDSIFNALKNDHRDSPEVLEYHRRFYFEDVLIIATEYERTQMALPTITFQDSLNLHLAQEMRVFMAGKAHTPSDIMLFLPEDKILMAGDIVTRPVPYGFTNYFDEWVSVLDKIIAIEPEYVIPGHGEPLMGTDYVEKLRALFVHVIEKVKAGIYHDLSVEEIRKSIDGHSSLEYFQNQGDVVKDRFQVWFLDPAIRRYYDRLKSQ